MLMVWGDRLAGGKGYVLNVEPLDVPPGASNEEAAAAMNACMERLILRRPDLYLWGYARYKQPRQEG